MRDPEKNGYIYEAEHHAALMWLYAIIALLIVIIIAGEVRYSKLPSDYRDGYEDGLNNGYEAGQTEGYEVGYSDGYSDGYSAGYYDGEYGNEKETS